MASERAQVIRWAINELADVKGINMENDWLVVSAVKNCLKLTGILSDFADNDGPDQLIPRLTELLVGQSELAAERCGQELMPLKVSASAGGHLRLEQELLHETGVIVLHPAQIETVIAMLRIQRTEVIEAWANGTLPELAGDDDADDDENDDDRSSPGV